VEEGEVCDRQSCPAPLVPGPAQGDEAHRVLSSLKNNPK